jgi:hypothetical protein
MFVEEESSPTEKHFTRSMTSARARSRNPSPVDDGGVGCRGGQGAQWDKKRAVKREQQEKAAMASESQRRQLNRAGRRTV